MCLSMNREDWLARSNGVLGGTRDVRLPPATNRRTQPFESDPVSSIGCETERTITGDERVWPHSTAVPAARRDRPSRTS